ncbi:MAG TPA: hypothetical protein VGO46_11980 [Gemmatimonadaceae bacterium]|jgi:hypothetical protein|nr:hypothetical protein [Gemmatimonadaceae bacterium]
MHFTHRRAMRPLRFTTTALMLTIALTVLGCHAAGPPRTGDDAPKVTTIDIQNQGFNDMTIYAIVGGARTRLGIANGNKTTTLTIPAYLVSTSTYFRFVADPIGGNRTPVTEEIDVSPGDQLVMIINPGQ